jgi:lipopolysaccharide kinase (Kdo/WaaP) family protein
MFETTRDSTGQLHCRKDLESHFENAGLKTYSDWMSLDGIDIREVSMRPTRPVVAIRVPGVREELFVKRHLEPARPVGPFQKLGLSRPASEGKKEADKLDGFRAAGIPCPDVAVWGEGEWEGNVSASFLVTKDLEALPMERYIFHNWKRPVAGDSAVGKRRLTEDLAILTRKMHRAGWVHRDFYLGHVFVREEPDPAGGRLAVIDVQRADRRPGWWIRSRIKDLASLHFSADPEYIRWTDRLRFIKVYWETDRPSRFQRFLIAWILSKARRIRKHTEKALGIPYSEYFKNKYY